MAYNDNTIFQLSKKFALRIIKLYKFLTSTKREFMMSKQIYRSGTSIGANLAESRFAQSNADYINKIYIALKEANETLYWLELLHDSGHIDDNQFQSMYNDNNIIVGTLVNILKKLNNKNNNE